jgi:hypothetical protein
MQTVKRVLLSGGEAAVSMLKEIREATEGSKVAIADPTLMTPEQRKARIEELLKADAALSQEAPNA